MIEGFVLVDKPGGWTSHDVVGRTRRLARQKKAGHAGTLDPMATGLVIVGLGRCTRLLRFVQEQPKVYEATAVFGVATDSLDADGVVVARSPLPTTAAEVESVLPRFRGPIQQVPPMVSALKQDGRRLYELAREGKVVDRPPRDVVVYALDVTAVADGEYPEVRFTVRCSSGTYVRSLADDIAQALGGRAHLTELRRTKNGGHDVGDAYTMDALERLESFTDAVLAPVAGLPELPAVVVDEATAKAVASGRRLAANVASEVGDRPFRVVYDGRLLAVYRTDGHEAKPEVVLA